MDKGAGLNGNMIKDQAAGLDGDVTEDEPAGLDGNMTKDEPDGDINKDEPEVTHRYEEGFKQVQLARYTVPYHYQERLAMHLKKLKAEDTITGKSEFN